MKIVAIALVMLSGCGRSPSAETGTAVELRLLGVNPGDYTAVLVEVKDLQVSGARSISPAQTKIDLTNPDHAWLVGTAHFPLAEGVDQVEADLALDDFGGFESAGAAGAIDVRTHIRFSSKFNPAKPEVTAIIDLKNSLAPVVHAPDRRILLPAFSVAH